MAGAFEDSIPPVEHRTSGVYAKPSPPSPVTALAELREITGDQPVAVLFFATAGRAPEAAAFPSRPRRVEAGYSLTHRLTSWTHGFTRSALAEVPAYLAPWFPSAHAIVVPIFTPDWEAGVLVLSPGCADRAPEIRALAADLALRLEQADRDGRLEGLGRVRRAG